MNEMNFYLVAENGVELTQSQINDDIQREVVL